MSNLISILFLSLSIFNTLLIFIKHNFIQEKTEVTQIILQENTLRQATKTESKGKIVSKNILVALTQKILKNSIYIIDNSGDVPETFNLKNGRAEIKYGIGGSQKVIVTMLDSGIRYGDLNDDKVEDAVVILAYYGGGSGTFIYLATVLNQEGKAVNVATEFLGDRIGIDFLSIENNQIFITIKERNSSEKISYKFNLEGQKLIKQAINNNILNKITFDISRISPEGLIGSDDNLRSLSYEFCIPKNPEYLTQIKDIDPKISFSNSNGRIGCTENQYLGIGDTHKPNWREILMAIANLDYVERIDQFFGE